MNLLREHYRDFDPFWTRLAFVIGGGNEAPEGSKAPEVTPAAIEAIPKEKLSSAYEKHAKTLEDLLKKMPGEENQKKAMQEKYEQQAKKLKADHEKQIDNESKNLTAIEAKYDLEANKLITKAKQEVVANRGKLDESEMKVSEAEKKEYQTALLNDLKIRDSKLKNKMEAVLAKADITINDVGKDGNLLGKAKERLLKEIGKKTEAVLGKATDEERVALESKGDQMENVMGDTLKKGTPLNELLAGLYTKEEIGNLSDIQSVTSKITDKNLKEAITNKNTTLALAEINLNEADKTKLAQANSITDLQALKVAQANTEREKERVTKSDKAYSFEEGKIKITEKTDAVLSIKYFNPVKTELTKRLEASSLNEKQKEVFIEQLDEAIGEASTEKEKKDGINKVEETFNDIVAEEEFIAAYTNLDNFKAEGAGDRLIQQLASKELQSRETMQKAQEVVMNQIREQTGQKEKPQTFLTMVMTLLQVFGELTKAMQTGDYQMLADVMEDAKNHKFPPEEMKKTGEKYKEAITQNADKAGLIKLLEAYMEPSGKAADELLKTEEKTDTRYRGQIKTPILNHLNEQMGGAAKITAIEKDGNGFKVNYDKDEKHCVMTLNQTEEGLKVNKITQGVEEAVSKTTKKTVDGKVSTESVETGETKMVQKELTLEANAPVITTIEDIKNTLITKREIKKEPTV